MEPYRPEPDYLVTLADGTVKQRNPFTGTEVWTVPGRGHRPLPNGAPDPLLLDDDQRTTACAFCSERYWETPPEKARVERLDGRWVTREHLMPEQVLARAAEFRRVPNLFEIVSYDFWRENYQRVFPESARVWRDAYLATPDGAQHVARVVGAKLRASGWEDHEIAALAAVDVAERAESFFGGTHDVIIARRHFADDATHTHQLAGSGQLTPEEHYRYVAFTVAALKSLYEANAYARYVAVFQNWLRPAGASFDHLHKQLAAIDERGPNVEATLPKLRHNPNLFNEVATNYAGYHNLMIAQTEHAVAFAGFGHRYPTIEIWSRSATSNPWDQSEAEVRGMSDLLHAMHAATGASVSTNEEWHHRPIDVNEAMPWRIMLKWRISTLAGFEGGTRINLNTISPYALRDRVVGALWPLRESGAVSSDLRIATECDVRPNLLRYRH